MLSLKDLFVQRRVLLGDIFAPECPAYPFMRVVLCRATPLASLTVLAQNWHADQDEIAIGPVPPGMEVEVDQGMGIVRLTRGQRVEEYEQALRSLVYVNLACSGKMDVTDRVFAVKALDEKGWALDVAPGIVRLINLES